MNNLQSCMCFLGVAGLLGWSSSGPLTNAQGAGGGEARTALSPAAAVLQVIDLGADLYNKNDVAGCYRLYQGALVSLKPLVGEPLQGPIDKALKAAERSTKVGDRAFELRAALDEVHAQLKKSAEGPTAWADPGVFSEALAQLINVGRDAYNKNGDAVGSWRIFEGGLLAAKPYALPASHATIDKGLAAAQKLKSADDKAFELRQVLDNLRVEAKTALASPETRPLPAVPKLPVPPPLPKKKADK